MNNIQACICVTICLFAATLAAAANPQNDRDQNNNTAVLYPDGSNTSGWLEIGPSSTGRYDELLSHKFSIVEMQAKSQKMLSVKDIIESVTNRSLVVLRVIFQPDPELDDENTRPGEAVINDVKHVGLNAMLSASAAETIGEPARTETTVREFLEGMLGAIAHARVLAPTGVQNHHVKIVPVFLVMEDEIVLIPKVIVRAAPVPKSTGVGLFGRDEDKATGENDAKESDAAENE